MPIIEECSELNLRYPIDSIIPYQGITAILILAVKGNDKEHDTVD